MRETLVDRATFYRGLALEAMPRLLGMLDREPFSPTEGSFDRDHWGWHFRDFPIGMLQAGLAPMALLWANAWPGNAYAGSGRLREWILRALKGTIARQHRNGSFDSVGPYTQDHGVTLQMAHTFAVTLKCLGDAVPDTLARQACEAVERACRFALASDEDYAFISNHRALFALAWLRSGALLHDDRLKSRGGEELAKVLEHQSDEGWYDEYGGADPGYQSLGMVYLTEYQREHPSDRLGESLRRAVDFMSHMIHPDGGLGGVYGSRMTSLWFPSGFERLAARNPIAAAATDALAVGMRSGAVVTTATTDAHNLPSLLYSCLLAGEAAAERSATATSTAELPRDSLRGTRYFPGAGLVVTGTDHYYAILNARRGGVGVIFSRSTGRLAWHDSGFVARRGSTVWSSAIDTPSSVVEVGDGDLKLRKPFTVANRETLTPLRFLLLRFANLTLWRSVRWGAWIRRWIVRRLITRRIIGPITLERTVHLAPNEITIWDLLLMRDRVQVDLLARVRSFTPLHMGSARYFQHADLDDVGFSQAILDAARFNRDRSLEDMVVVVIDDRGGAVRSPVRLHN